MGWYGVEHNLKGMIAELTKNKFYEKDGVQREARCIAKCWRGSSFAGTLWTVWEEQVILPGENYISRYIQCDMAQYIKGWMYKPLSESCGPYAYNCPEKYLKMCPEVLNASWRKGVEQYHENRRAKLKRRRNAA